MFAAAYALIHQSVPAILRTPIAARTSDNSAVQLMIHRIPAFCTAEHIKQMLVEYTNVVPISISAIERVAGNHDESSSECFGRAVVVFSSLQHAELAFNTIQGPNRPDKQGRPQKRVYFKNGGHMYVRR